jgi:hypothetical protein
MYMADPEITSLVGSTCLCNATWELIDIYLESVQHLCNFGGPRVSDEKADLFELERPYISTNLVFVCDAR